MKDGDILELKRLKRKLISRFESFNNKKEDNIMQILENKESETQSPWRANLEKSDDDSTDSENEQDDLVIEAGDESITSIGSEESFVEEHEEEQLIREEGGDLLLSDIDIKTIEGIAFQDRADLKDKMDFWAAEERMKLFFSSQERTNITDGVSVSTLYCCKKKSTKCDFYLEFRTDPQSQLYYLDSYFNSHNHSLLKYHDASALTPKMIERIKSLAPIAKSKKSIVEEINKEFRRNFHPRTLYYQIKKIGESEFGNVTEDAKMLVSFLEKDAEARGSFYSVELKDNKLAKCCFMTSRMKDLFKKFNNAVIIETTHKVNRFNLPLLDVTLVNNLGKSVTAFIALLSDQKYDSFLWALNKLKSQLTRMPILIFSDDGTALRNGSFFLLFFHF